MNKYELSICSRKYIWYKFKILIFNIYLILKFYIHYPIRYKFMYTRIEILSLSVEIKYIKYRYYKQIPILLTLVMAHEIFKSWRLGGPWANGLHPASVSQDDRFYCF